MINLNTSEIAIKKAMYKKLKNELKNMSKDQINKIGEAVDHEIRGTDDYKKFLKLIVKVSIRHDRMKKRSDILKMDRIDYYLSLTDSQYDSIDELPDIDTGVLDAVENNFYLALPPFKKGVLRINKQRYIEWNVDLAEDDGSYAVSLADYVFDIYNKVWYLNAIGQFLIVKTDDGGINIETVEFHNAVKIFASNIKDYKDEIISEMDEVEGYKSKEECFKGFSLALLRHNDVDEKIESDWLLGRFFLAIAETNVILQQSKLKTLRGSSKSKVKTMAGEIDTNPKPKKTRVLPNGVEFVSDKIPRVYDKDSIRKYTIESWHTRGHIRHYKNGKITYVKESVHHRKCLENKGSSVPAQQIIQVV